VIDYDVGDVVVCVDGRSAMTASYWHPKKGGIYRVSDMGKCKDGSIWAEVAEDPNPSDNTAWDATRFRKLPPATDDFKRLMRECRPKVDA